MSDLNTPEQALVCVVEIPKGVRNKYEYDPELGGIKFDRLPLLLRQEIEQFFSIYKELEGKTVSIGGWRSREEAVQEIVESQERLSRR